MNNQELQQAIQEILDKDNYFDAIEAASEFEKEYKNSEFFKKTKKPLKEVLREAKVFYTFNFKKLSEKVQTFINELDVSKLNSLFDQIAATFGQENQEINSQLESLEDFKNIIGK